MEMDFRSSLLRQDMQVPNAKSYGLPLFDIGLQSTGTSSAACGLNNTVSMNGNYPVDELPLPREEKEPHGRFHCLPHFKQSLFSGANVVLDKKLLCGTVPSDHFRATTAQCSPKQFLVFDQSGDKTTFIYSSVTGAPVCLNSWDSNSRSPCFKCTISDGVKLDIRSGAHNLSGPNLTDELNDNDSEAEVSDVREDTEEINALLYSDDENNSDENGDHEETSTGHSPSRMTAYNDDKRDCFVEEEVASSGAPAKRRRISQDVYDVQSLMDTASSARADRAFQQEDNAESRADSGDDSLCGMKRSRKERIRETVEVLRSIIPGGKGKDSFVVLDESIRYLRSLKLKAKSLGLLAV